MQTICQLIRLPDLLLTMPLLVLLVTGVWKEACIILKVRCCVCLLGMLAVSLRFQALLSTEFTYTGNSSLALFVTHYKCLENTSFFFIDYSPIFNLSL